MEHRQPVPARADTPTMAPMPLANAGVTCWWNALIQTMLSIRRLTETVLRYRDVLCAPIDPANGDMTPANPTAAAYIAIIDAHIAGKPIGRLHLDLLRVFTDGIAIKGKAIISATAQECANEAFVQFIAMFAFDPIERMFLHVYSTTFTCGGCKKIIQQPQDHSVQVKLTPPIAPPGPGQYAEAYRKWTFRLQADTSELDSYTCEDCKHTTRHAFRISKMHAVHDIITVLFPQFDAVKRINWFPAEFRLSRAAEISTANGVRVIDQGWHTYRVKSAMYHTGNANSGHHYTVCERALRPGDKSPYEANDKTPVDAVGRHADPANGLYRLDDAAVVPLPTAIITPSPYIHMVVYELVHAG